jgi:hypothetical protein
MKIAIMIGLIVGFQMSTHSFENRYRYSNLKLFVASASLSQLELVAERSLYQLILDCYS